MFFSKALSLKLAVAVFGILISLDLFAQTDPAYVEWERVVALPTAVPTTPGVMLALLGLALLAYGTHHIWRQRNTSVHLLAIVAMTGGIMLAIQSAPHLIGVANAVLPTIDLDVSPKALDFGHNAIKNVQSFPVRVTALRDGTGKVDQTQAYTPECQVGMVLPPDEVCHAYVEKLLTCPCWNTFTESLLVAAMNAEVPLSPRCETYPLTVLADDQVEPVPFLSAAFIRSIEQSCVLRVGETEREFSGLDEEVAADCLVEGTQVVSQITWCSRIVFVTSGTYTGDLVTEAATLGLGEFTDDGLGAGDAICTKLSGDEGLPGSYTAWLSDSTTPAQDRVSHSNFPYVLTNGLQVAADYQDLTFEDATTCTGNGSADCLDHMIDRNESQGLVAQDQVWTSTLRDGTVNGVDFCDDWTSADGGLSGAVGITNGQNKNWTQQTGSYCNSPKRLYCFQD